MQLNIKIDANYEEPVTLITTARMTDEVNRIVDFINQSDAVTTIISGIKNGKVELLEQIRTDPTLSYDEVERLTTAIEDVSSKEGFVEFAKCS